MKYIFYLPSKIVESLRCRQVLRLLVVTTFDLHNRQHLLCTRLLDVNKGKVTSTQHSDVED